MNEVAHRELLPTCESIERMQELMSRMDQVNLETKHYFADGMYCRELIVSALVTAVGKVHKREHFFIVTSLVNSHLTTCISLISNYYQY